MVFLSRYFGANYDKWQNMRYCAILMFNFLSVLFLRFFSNYERRVLLSLPTVKSNWWWTCTKNEICAVVLFFQTMRGRSSASQRSSPTGDERVPRSVVEAKLAPPPTVSTASRIKQLSMMIISKTWWYIVFTDICLPTCRVAEVGSLSARAKKKKKNHQAHIYYFRDICDFCA